MSWLDQTIACSITVHTWGNSKGVKAATLSEFSGELATHAADKRLSVSKKLLKCVEYEAILSRDSEANAWMKRHSVPSLLRGGIYAVPVQFVDQGMPSWSGYLDEYIYDRCMLVNGFCPVYADAVHAARGELGPLYSSLDYPPELEVRSKFSIDVRYVELGVPGRLEEIAPGVFSQAREQLDRTIREGQQHIEAMLVAEVEEMVQGLQGALQGLDDGTLKRFHPSHLEKITEWSGIFSDIRNVTGFAELEAVTTRLADVIAGVRPGAVKEFGMIRAELRRELQGAQVALKGMMEDRPSRMISLE